MRPTQIAVLASFLVCAAIVGIALFLTPGIKAQMSQDALSTVLGFLVVSMLCGWPWLRAYTAAGDDNETPQSVIFGVASIAIAGSFFTSISGAPAEGVGWYAILCVLSIWLARVVIFWFFAVHSE